MDIPFFVTIPHSGEEVPDFCTWLSGLSEPHLMCDVDRYVDVLYAPVLETAKIPYIKTKWHRYAGDLNRIPEDVDSSSVEGNTNPKGMHNRGFHWTVTTTNLPLMSKPMSQEMHDKIVKLIYEPFHESVRNQYAKFREQSAKKIYQIDAHSMPSLGTKMHRDPGERRADIVVSDCGQKSSSKEFVDLVIAAYVRAGFKVGYNWPYLGGRVSEQYGNPERGQHVVQVELNRDLYMDEVTKKLKPSSTDVQKKLQTAIAYVVEGLSTGKF